ncbi:MAG: winged helix-turn-helix transcriptional regulator [Dehalobacter sp. 4CP]|jgi:hypothetical protein|nr:winged helix-turn-helix domain-containing protein [Sphaerochaetaceae bacterium]NBJ15742.1 winged helix-turn-helix transcriptional regulator [Dehalobacter sp. 4CP]
MAAPFEGLFGDTSELRVIQFLLPLRKLEFNVSELARGTGISRQTMVSVTKKLTKWNVLKLTSKHGNANYYAINDDSMFVEAFETLNNCIIEQMVGQEELNRIANYSLEHSLVCIDTLTPPQSSYIKGVECSETPANVWLRPSQTNRSDQSEFKESQENSKIGIYLGGSNNAVAA